MEKLKSWKIALLVDDFEAAEDFYVKVHGMRVISRSPSGAAFLDAGNVNLEIIPKRVFEGQGRLDDVGVYHLFFKVTDIGKAADELKTKGASFIKDPYGPRQGLTLAIFDGLDNVNLQLFKQECNEVCGCGEYSIPSTAISGVNLKGKGYEFAELR